MVDSASTKTSSASSVLSAMIVVVVAVTIDPESSPDLSPDGRERFVVAGVTEVGGGPDCDGRSVADVEVEVDFDLADASIVVEARAVAASLWAVVAVEEEERGEALGSTRFECLLED